MSTWLTSLEGRVVGSGARNRKRDRTPIPGCVAAPDRSANAPSNRQVRSPQCNCEMPNEEIPPYVAAVSLEQEINPWEAQAARFDFAAQKLNLDEGLWKVLRYPSREIIVHFPVVMDDGTDRSVHRFSRAAFDCARAGQGRHPLCARRDARRGPRAGQLDDVEVRGGQYPVRRRQGRRDLRSEEDVAWASWSA